MMGQVCSVCSSEREPDFPVENADHGPGSTVTELYHVMEPRGTDHLFGIKRKTTQLSNEIVPPGKSVNQMFQKSKLMRNIETSEHG